MKLSTSVLAGVILALALAMTAHPARAQGSPAGDDRLILGANGSTLTGGSGGGGGAVTWLHDFGAGTLAGVGAEHQAIANSHWTLGSVIGAVTLGAESGPRTSFSGELHEGSGDIARRSFNYSLAVLGASRTLTKELSVQLEDRQIDIDTTHGNLPKLGLTYAWTRRFQTSLAYAHSVGGNLGTELTTARIDIFGARASFLAGGATGHATPAVVNLQTGLEQPPALSLKQVFVGVFKPFSRANLQLVLDYLDLAGNKRTTLTLTCTLPLGGRGTSK
ncbi:MAG: hypothetical protein JWL65_3888 [Gammaproteobacteria bacterium]|jgi:hypothetical protein|nr:hypothetical protein [Gammaproteobacteria bacterium]